MTGAELRQIRLDLGMTQKEMGQWIGYQGDPSRACRRIEASSLIPARVAWIVEHLVIPSQDPSTDYTL